MRQAKNKSEDAGPDGITGVVPAPPRPPSPSKDVPLDASPSPEPPKLTEKSPRRGSLVPEVKISVPRSRPNSSNGPVKELKTKELKKTETHRSITAGNDSKYLQTLGVDPSILDDRSDEFCTWLDHFGWIPGQQMRTRNIEEMKTDLERELNKAQAGGWLARFREEDERVDAIKQGMDLAMAECEELDNLLTLYSVELSVGQHYLC